MAKHPAKCPKCGSRVDYDSAVGEHITCNQCGAVLAVPRKPDADSGSPTLAASASPPPGDVDPLIGQSLGEFEIIELLGRGGMGAVYKARQASLDRMVAIKILPHRLASNESFVERFSREARAAAGVRHANIIEIHSIGEAAGHQYIAMEFIEGETLADLLKREGRLSPDRALDMLKLVASALAEAHECGILHRDIKPSNILIDAKGRIKVADFGLAKHEGVDVSITVTGTALGTPLYMPPEAARGEPFDARSDLYSLGATFYQAIAGKTPFDGETPAQLIVKHLEAQVPPLQTLAPDAPVALCRIIHRLLRKTPAERYPSAEKLLEALARIEAPLVGGASLPRVRPSLSPRERAGVRGDGQATATPPPDARPATRRAVGAGPPSAGLRARRARLLLFGGIAAAIVLVLLFLLVFARDGRPPPAAVAPPATRAPSTPDRPPPPPSAKNERNAQVVFRNAQTVAARGEWEGAKAYLDRLEAKYGDTGFVSAHRAEIDALRAKVDAAPRPAPPPPKPPEPKPEPAPEAVAEAKWEEIKEKAEKLRAAGDYDGATKLLESAKEIKLGDIAERIAEAEEEVAAAKRQALDRAVAAYAEESDKVWALFRRRQYQEAEKLIASLKAKPEFKDAAWEHAAHNLRADEQALELLKELWAAVERALAGKKGDFIAFGGAGGKIAEVKDGQVTVRGAGGAEFKLPLLKLGAKQALHYSGLKLKADPRSKLMAAVLSIADGTALDEAREALEKAGDGPSVGIYRERLDALEMGAAETAARRAWLRIEAAASGRLSRSAAQRLTATLAALEKQHGGTKLYRGLGEKLAALKTRIDDSLPYTRWPFDAAEAKRRQKVTAHVMGVKVEQELDLGGGVKMPLVLIPAGEFLMGSPPTTSPERIQKTYGDKLECYQREFPQHRVKISKPFWLGKTEVTQAQWQAVMGNNPSEFKGKPQNPVEGVSWHDCQGFLQKLSTKFRKPFRLPTEAEWEYACRAGTPSDFYFGNSRAALLQHAWWAANSGRMTHPVGERKPNTWGLHDMAGNVWEWCEDRYAAYGKASQVDPNGPEAGAARVLRGGSWGSGHPGNFRCADRDNSGPSHRSDNYGFRASRTIDAAPQPQPGAQAPPLPAQQKEARPAAQATKADAALAKLLEPIEPKVAAWDFAGAAAELAKLKVEDKALAEQVARRREEVGRMAGLKAKMIERINRAKPRLTKRSLGIKGMNADLVKANEKGITTAKLPTGKTETFAWQDLSARSAMQLARLSIDAKSADDWLAVGLLALHTLRARVAATHASPQARHASPLQDVTAAEQAFEKARKLGASIARYLDPLAAASFARAKALLQEARGVGTPRLQEGRGAETPRPHAERMAGAVSLLEELQAKYGKTSWFAAHKQEVEAARQQAKAGIAEAEAAIADAGAEKLYAQAAKLYNDHKLFELKPVIDRLQAAYPDSRAVKDADRKPPFATMAKLVAELGKKVTVAQKGRADFRSIQDAINAVPANSVIEIQDGATYDGQLIIPADKRRLTLRGKPGCWPIIRDHKEHTITVRAPDVTLEQLVVVGKGIDLLARKLRLRSALVSGPVARLSSGLTNQRVDLAQCLLTGGVTNLVEVSARDTVLLRYGIHLPLRHGERSHLDLENVLAHQVETTGKASIRGCTVRNGVTVGGAPFVIRDTICTQIQAKQQGSTIERCCVHGKGFLLLAKPGEGCFKANPQFRDPQNLDYRLKRTSPCRGKASDGGDIGCRYTPEMLEMLKLAHELRRKGIIKF